MELNKEVSAIVQARMGSSRLPGKVLKPIQGKPMLWHIVDRINQVKEINRVIVATSKMKIDDPIYEFTKKYNILSFRGDESDVLKRFYDTALHYNLENIIRITGDCPLIDPDVIKNLIRMYLKEDCDYSAVACGACVSNMPNINRFPDGFDCEIFSLKSLKKANDESSEALQREHVTPFIWKQKERFKVKILYSKSIDCSELRLTVDNIEDFELIKWIYDKLYPKNNNFKFKEIIELLKNSPPNKNKHLIGSEGYEQFWK